jgi:hypothetical protein
MQKVIYWLKNKDLFQLLKSAGVLIIPAALYFVPLEWLKTQDSICLFKNLTGYECLGCGMTRAILSATHFQFENAFHYNKLFLIVFPLLVYIWAKTLLTLWLGVASPFTYLWGKKNSS